MCWTVYELASVRPGRGIPSPALSWVPCWGLPAAVEAVFVGGTGSLFCLAEVRSRSVTSAWPRSGRALWVLLDRGHVNVGCRARCLRGGRGPTGSRRVFPRDLRYLFLVCFCGQFARLMDWGSTSLICWRLCCKLPRLMSLRNVCRCFHWQVTSNACFSASSLWRVIVLPLWVLGLWSFDSFTCLHLFLVSRRLSVSCLLGAVRALFGSILRGSGKIPSSVEGVEFFFGRSQSMGV